MLRVERPIDTKIEKNRTGQEKRFIDEYLALECERHGCLECEHEVGGLEVAVGEVRSQLE